MSLLQVTVVRSELEKLKKEHEKLKAELSKVCSYPSGAVAAAFHTGCLRYLAFASRILSDEPHLAHIAQGCCLGGVRDAVTGIACLQATEERNSAQVRIAAAEDTATQAFEEVGNMRDEVADLKERLAKVRPSHAHMHCAWCH